MNTVKKKIFFAGFIFALMIVMSLIVASILRPNQQTPLQNLVSNSDETKRLGGARTIAAWIWQSPTEIEPKVDSIIEFSKNEGINTLYIYVDEYLDIYEMPKGSQRDLKMSQYENALKKFVSKAKEANIVIHALSGSTAYSYDSHSYIPPILINHVFEFNHANPDLKIDGIQFDIEFYEDPRFFGSPKEYVQEYIKEISDLADMTKRLNQKYSDEVRLGFVIPFWFDQANQYLERPIINDVINSLSRTQNSYLIVMAYRNVVEGQGGSLDISKKELEEAGKSSVKVIIAQELVQNKETKITLFGKSRKEIKEQLTRIINEAGVYSSFEGVSIHDLNAFMKVN